MRRPLPVLVAGLAVAALPSLQSVAGVHHVIFARVGPFQSQLFVARGDGSDERPIAPATGLDYSPSLSSDKAWVIFTSERAGSADSWPSVYRFNIDGQGAAHRNEVERKQIMAIADSWERAWNSYDMRALAHLVKRWSEPPIRSAHAVLACVARTKKRPSQYQSPAR